MDKPLWKHQALAIQKGNEIPSLALFMDPGVGKSRTTIEVLRRKYAANKGLMRTLIIAPIITLPNWKNEFKMFSKVDQRDIIIVYGSGGARVKAIMKWFLPPEEVPRQRIMVTNYECMQMDNVFELIKAWCPEIVVCDESHRCKNHDSVRAKRVITLADTAKHKYILTGTPILNTPMDIYNQFRILDGGESFGKNFWAFRNKYFQDENAAWSGKQGHFPKYVPRVESYSEFNRLIYQKAVRAVKSQCLDLPSFVRQVVTVELSKEQRRMYDEMKSEYITFIENMNKEGKPRAVVAQLAITKGLRLMQIVSGYAGTDDGLIHVIKENPRLDALEELLEDITPTAKVIVWCCFKQNYEAIKALCKKLKLEYAEIHGEIKDKESEMKRFRSNPKTKVMIANQNAGGVGINLVEASYMIYFSRNFSLEADLQSEARAYRGGSEIHSKVTRLDIIANDTIDSLVAETLANKLNVAQRILDFKL